MGIESRVKQLLRRSYRFAWSFDLWRYGHASRHQGRPLVVYQMGKVGSTSVYRALQAAAPECSVYHVHTLVAEQIASAQRAYARSYHLRGVVPHHLMASRHLRSDLERGQPRGRWKVLTLVRDPIARNVSSFFQDLQLRHPDFPYAGRLASGDTERLAADLVELFLSRHDHDEPLRWCDRELRGVLGVDVYAAPFPHDRGWACCEGPLAEVLVIRLEDLDAALDPALGTFLGSGGLTLPKANVATDKSYGDLYRAFRRQLRLPEGYIERMYGSRFARHFYSPAERETFASRWLPASTG